MHTKNKKPPFAEPKAWSTLLLGLLLMSCASTTPLSEQQIMSGTGRDNYGETHEITSHVVFSDGYVKMSLSRKTKSVPYRVRTLKTNILDVNKRHMDLLNKAISEYTLIDGLTLVTPQDSAKNTVIGVYISGRTKACLNGRYVTQIALSQDNGIDFSEPFGVLTFGRSPTNCSL